MSLRANVAWGVRRGVTAGLFFVGWAALVFLARGTVAVATPGGGSLTLAAVIAAYLAGGALAGAVVGALRPLGRSRPGSALLGLMAAVPLFVAIRFAAEGPAPWTRGDTVLVGVCALFAGPLTGLALHEGLVRRAPAGRRRRKRERAR